MDITLEDVQAMALDLWLAQREIVRLRADNNELQRMVDQGGQAAPVPPRAEP